MRVAARPGQTQEGDPPPGFSRNNYIAEGAHFPGPRKVFTQPRNGVRVVEIGRPHPTPRTQKQYDVAGRLTRLPHLRRRGASTRRSRTVCNPSSCYERTTPGRLKTEDNRLRTKQIPVWNDAPAHQVAWSYTLAGRTTLADDAAGQTSVYLIDSAGRTTDELATAVAQGGTLHVAWTLDKSGNRTKLTWPDGYAVDYAFDGLNRLSAVTEDSTSASLAAYTYDPLSRRTSLAYNGGTSSMAYSYSNAGDLLTLQNDLAGTANDVTFTSAYTPAHQLQSVTTSNAAYIWSPSAAASSAYAAVNNLNQYPSVDSAAMTWDGNGNLLSNGPAAFAHDAENRMLAAAGGGIASAYLYDTTGRRTVKTVQTPDLATTRYLHEGPNEIGEYTQFGGLIRRFIPGAAIDEYVAMEMSGTDDGVPGPKTYFHTDRQGSVIAMADSTGALAEGPYTYDAYGNCFVGSASCATLPPASEPFRFTGQRFDGETGLYFYRTRYYHPGIGRFAETDQAGYGPDINWYVSFGNDPTDKTDPAGRGDPVDPNLGLPLMQLLGGASPAQAQQFRAGMVQGMKQGAGVGIGAVATIIAIRVDPKDALAGGAISFAGYGLGQVATQQPPTFSGAVNAIETGAVSGVLPGDVETQSLVSAGGNAIGQLSETGEIDRGQVTAAMAATAIGEFATGGLVGMIPGGAQALGNIGKAAIETGLQNKIQDNMKSPNGK